MSKDRNKHRKEERSPQGGMPVGSRVIPATSPAGFEALREGPEPTAGRVAVPVLLIALLGLLIYVADTNMINRGGEFHPQVYYPFQSIEAVTIPPPPDPIHERQRVGRGIYT